MKQLAFHVEADDTDLCLGFLGLERGLGNDFTREPSFSRILNLEYTGKTSLPEKAHTSKLETVVSIYDDLWWCWGCRLAVLAR